MVVQVINQDTEQIIAHYNNISHIPRIGDAMRINNYIWHVDYVMWCFENSERVICLVDRPIKCQN